MCPTPVTVRDDAEEGLNPRASAQWRCVAWLGQRPCTFVAGAPDLHKLLHLHLDLLRRRLGRGLLGLLGRPPGSVGRQRCLCGLSRETPRPWAQMLEPSLTLELIGEVRAEGRVGSKQDGMVGEAPQQPPSQPRPQRRDTHRLVWCFFPCVWAR